MMSPQSPLRHRPKLRHCRVGRMITGAHSARADRRLPRMARRAVTAVATALPLLLAHVVPRAVAAGTKLVGHSIGAPPDVAELAEHWSLAGAVIPSMQSLVLNPGVPNRVGMLWHRYPVLTNDFEVNLKFTVKAPEKRTATEEGFAFWYVYENGTAAQQPVTKDFVENQEAMIANTWDYAMQASGFHLVGYRSQFDGLGVVFSSDAEGNAVAQAAHNDGKKDLKLGAVSESSLKFDRTKEVAVKIRVQKTSAKVDIEGHGSIDVTADFKAGGYVGISAYGGKKAAFNATDERADFVELWDFSMFNHDASQEGEKLPEKSAPAPAKTAEEKSDVLADASSFKDHRAESEAIKELTNMVFKLVVETQPQRAQLTSAIEAFGKRITAMEETFENLKKEIDKKTGHKLGEEFDAIKRELTSLSDVASAETQERHKRLDSLHEDISDVHKTASSPDNIDHHLSKLTESNQRTLDQMSTEHQKMFGVSIAAIAFVVIGGLSLYNKFRCWEKKHIL
eukprot:TRINITY_DN38579_c0_g1_i1.p1 TRINITY_DN38579_c0_g1~~TRINITY_DN38579_c0_g1_i1.p1  ORF type:complete len:509 (+),score=157.70 TRINITY_DN38579_c0_g1_i1:36-1562(+)